MLWRERSSRGRPSEISQKAMSALPPKADVCGATRDVRYGPKADILVRLSREQLETRNEKIDKSRADMARLGDSSHFRLSETLAMPALAQASSFSPPGAPETPTPPITSLPDLIGTPPPTATTFGICFR